MELDTICLPMKRLFTVLAHIDCDTAFVHMAGAWWALSVSTNLLIVIDSDRFVLLPDPVIETLIGVRRICGTHDEYVQGSHRVMEPCMFSMRR